jgi:hypothetical protein
MTAALWHPEQVFFRIGLMFLSKPAVSTAAEAALAQMKAAIPYLSTGLTGKIEVQVIGMSYLKALQAVSSYCFG